MQEDLLQPPILEDVRQKLKQLVANILRLDSNIELKDDVDLYEWGLDSTSTIELVFAVQERFEITIEEAELELSLFQNLDHLTELIFRKLQKSAQHRYQDMR